MSLDNILPDDFALLREAIALARAGAAAGVGGPFGAVVAIGGRIVGTGQNRVTSTNDPTAHAEVVAIRAACSALGRFHLKGATLYTSCEPCPMCLAASYWAHVDRIVYSCTRDDAAAIGFDDAFLYRELTATATERRIPAQPALREEGLVAFREWAANPLRTPY
jgi:tRNA(Arg) A34 adenosine deaminase TadA